MLRKLGPSGLALVLAAMFAAGCGDDDKSDSGSDSGNTPAVTAETTDEATTDDTATEDSASDDAGGTDLSDNPQVKAAIEQCHESVDANPSVKDEIKDDLKDLCDKAASGDPQDIKDATREVCEKVVESSVPEGDARDTAMESCKAAGG